MLNESRDIAIELLIKPFEGCHRVLPNGMIAPYICPAGYPTQGWGIVVPSMSVPPITPAMADAILARETPRYMTDALNASPILALYPRRLAAVTSFVFNLGATRYRSSTLRRRINAQDWDAAAAEFDKWVFAGGRKLAGLVRRRAAERKVFESETRP
ncbi:MAG: lysozyme [Burkholderiales bacterium]|jgi:lysozyme